MRNLGNQLFGAIFLVAGVAVVHWGWSNLQKTAEVKTWPTVSGVVVETSITSSVPGNQQGRNIKVYTPHVRYSYKVSGIPFSANNISVGGENVFDSKDSVEAMLSDKYPIDGVVTVHYNPINKFEAYLEVKPPKNNFVPFIVGFAFIGGGVFFVFWTKPS